MTWTLAGVNHNRLPSLNVPNTGCAIITGGDDILAVWGKYGFIHNIGMSLEAAYFFAGGNIPKLSNTVLVCREHLLAIRREDSATRFNIRLPAEHNHGLTRRCIPNTHGAILAGSDYLFAIGRERSLPHPRTRWGELHSYGRSLQ